MPFTDELVEYGAYDERDKDRQRDPIELPDRVEVVVLRIEAIYDHQQSGREYQSQDDGRYACERGLDIAIFRKSLEHGGDNQDDEERGQHYAERGNQRPPKAGLI